MSRHTGRRVDDLEHIRQSIADILTTPVGSRVMRRDYGSQLPELIDQPLNGATLLRAYSATIVALIRWEPRLQVRAITRLVRADLPGAVTLGLEGARTDSGDAVSLDVSLTPESRT
jgi:phage baseplate assembly protein W